MKNPKMSQKTPYKTPYKAYYYSLVKDVTGTQIYKATDLPQRDTSQIALRMENHGICGAVRDDDSYHKRILSVKYTFA
jgi:hypothetical protein